MKRNTTLGVLGLALVLASSVYAQSARSQGVTATKIQGSGNSLGDASYATASDQSTMTPVQNVLMHYMITKQSFLLESTRDQGTIDKIILNNCASILTVMTPPQQKYELNNVFQIDRYRPGSGPWDQVRNSPSLVKELLTLTKEQSAKIDAIMTASSDKFMAPITALTATARFKALPREQQHREMQAVSDKIRAGRTSAEMYALAVIRVKDEIAKTRPILNPAQLAEFDRIVTRFDSLMRLVAPIAEPNGKA